MPTSQALVVLLRVGLCAWGVWIALAVHGQSAVSSTWHLPLDDYALQVRMARNSDSVMTPSVQPLSTWLRPATLKPSNVAFQGLNVVGEFRLIGGDFRALSTSYGLSTQGSLNNRWGYHVSALRWRLPLGSPLANEILHYGTMDGLGRAQLIDAYGDIAYVDRMEWAISRTLSRSVELRVGTESHHWGPGARSLFLDRHMAPALGARLWVDAGLVQYSHAILRTVHPLADSDDVALGWMAAHMVEVSLGAGWTGSVFGAVKWRQADASFEQRLDPHYLVPFVAFRPMEYHQGSADNALIGTQLTKRFANSAGHRFTTYGQLLFDELLVGELLDTTQWWGNKWGLLAGAHMISTDGRFGWLVEGACVRPWVYAHNTEPLSYTHLHQPLGHPGGGNFIEGRLRLRYKHNDEWIGRLSVLRRTQGMSTGTAEFDLSYVAGDLPTASTSGRSGDDGHGLLQGVRSDLTRLEIDVAKYLGTKYSVGGVEAFFRAWIRLETHDSDDAWQAPWDANRVEIGVRHSRVMQERDW